MARHDEAKAGGLFDRIGNFVVRWPLIVIGCWIAVAAALTLLLPTLQAQAAKREQAPLPPGAPSMVLQKEMSAAFQEKIETSALLLVLLTNENGLGPADEAVYRKLIENLRADTQDKISVQDFLAVPEMKELLASKDNKAWNLPITFAGDAASPETQAAFKRVAAIVKQTVAGTSLTVHLSGPIATVADLTELGEKDVRIIEIGTAVSVLIILILVYRNLVTMLVPLATIGASVVTAQGTLSGLAEFGLAVNMQAIVFMSAVMIGAGTDYAVFLISRYHDYVRHGEKSDMAVKKALMSIGKVITASAATVAVTFLAMVFTKPADFFEGRVQEGRPDFPVGRWSCGAVLRAERAESGHHRGDGSGQRYPPCCGFRATEYRTRGCHDRSGGGSDCAAGYPRLLQQRYEIHRHCDDRYRILDSRHSAARTCGSDISDRLGADFLLVGPRHRNSRFPIDTGPGNALEPAGTVLHIIGCHRR